jgi:hypothetical protein
MDANTFRIQTGTYLATLKGESKSCDLKEYISLGKQGLLDLLTCGSIWLNQTLPVKQYQEVYHLMHLRGVSPDAFGEGAGASVPSHPHLGSRGSLTQRALLAPILPLPTSVVRRVEGLRRTCANIKTEEAGEEV